MTRTVDLTSQAFFRDRAAAVRRLQAAGPVVEMRFPMVGRVWMTTTQEMASRVLKDGALFTMRKDDGAVTGMRWWMPGILRVLTNNMLNVDEPDHARLRGIVDEAFRRRAVLDMEPRVRAIADELAGDLFAQGSPAEARDRAWGDPLAQPSCLQGDRQPASGGDAGWPLLTDAPDKRAPHPRAFARIAPHALPPFSATAGSARRRSRRRSPGRARALRSMQEEPTFTDCLPRLPARLDATARMPEFSAVVLTRSKP